MTSHQALVNKVGNSVYVKVGSTKLDDIWTQIPSDIYLAVGRFLIDPLIQMHLQIRSQVQAQLEEQVNGVPNPLIIIKVRQNKKDL